MLFIAISGTPLHADEFSWFKGRVLGVWKSSVVFGAAVREVSPHPDLVGAGAATSGEFPGATGAIAVVDDYQLNYPKGSLVAAPATFFSDLRLMSGTSGVFIRVRAWYEMALNAKKFPHGNPGNIYASNAQLSDDGFVGAGKFQGIDIHDAFFFGDYRLGRSKLHLRVGRQVVHFGEGLIYPGINAMNPNDYAWLSQTGSQVLSGGYLPVARVFTGFSFPNGLSVDGFYNLEFRSSVFPGCGTWYSFVDNGFQPGCNIVIAAGVPDQTLSQLALKSYWAGTTPAAGAYPEGGPPHPGASGEPEGDGQFGFAVRQFVEPIGAEIGVYFSKYTSHFPTISMLPGPTALDFAVNNMWAGDQKAWAVSIAGGVRNVALSAQFTRTHDVPGQRNFPEMIRGLFENKGPYGGKFQEYIGGEFPGYYLLNVNQFQFGGTAQIGPLLRLRNATLTTEANMMWHTNLPPVDGPGAERILRFGNFGYANYSEPGGECPPMPLPNGIVHKCEVDGFATPFAMGVKSRFATVFPQFWRQLTMTPAVAFGFDPVGFSSDGSITGGRVSAAGLLRINQGQRYYGEVGATWFRRGAEWDANRDKGVYTFTFGINLH
jgi:hypothetical protein